MLIRMTGFGTTTAALLATLAAAAGGALGSDPDGAAAGPGAALVIDAAAGRDGRELVDERIRGVDAEVRLPRSAAEARTNVRYFAELGYGVIVSGPRSSAAARATGVPAERANGLVEALRAADR